MQKTMETITKNTLAGQVYSWGCPDFFLACFGIQTRMGSKKVPKIIANLPPNGRHHVGQNPPKSAPRRQKRWNAPPLTAPINRQNGAKKWAQRRQRRAAKKKRKNRKSDEKHVKKNNHPNSNFTPFALTALMKRSPVLQRLWPIVSRPVCKGSRWNRDKSA